MERAIRLQVIMVRASRAEDSQLGNVAYHPDYNATLVCVGSEKTIQSSPNF